MEQVVAALSHKHWDLGSIPRSPPFSILFCLICSYAACLPMVHHASTIKACHMAQETNLKVRIWSPPWTSVKRSTRIPEKSKGPSSNGPNCWEFTSNFGSTPLLFVSLSLFLFLSFYFICFNYFLLIHKINFK